MTIEIVDVPMKNGGSFHSYVAVYQRVLIQTIGCKIPSKWQRKALHHLTKVYQLKFGFIENGIPTDYDNPPQKVVGIIPERTISESAIIYQ